MRIHGCMFALLLASTLGCSDRAIIGGVCVGDCAPGIIDASPGGCVGDACEVDAGDDACSGDTCSVDAGNGCREGAYELTRTRLDLMLVIDDAGSLAPWWFALHDGLDQFLRTTSPTGLGLGLQRFDEVCEASHYVDPIVPIAPLSDNRAALEQAVQIAGIASTSTVPALDGVHQYARAWAASNGGAPVAVVLLTDVAPGACDGLVGDFAAEAARLARVAYEGTPSIKTYVINFGVFTTAVDIARAGGTEAAIIQVTPADGEVLAALENVRRDAASCAFSWQSGWTLAPDSAVVVSTLNGTERRYPIVAGASACAQQDGFYVEDSAASHPLIACSATCDALATGERLTLSRACPTP